MPRTKKIIQPDAEVNVAKTKKRNATKRKKSKLVITKEMIAVAAYYKAELRGFNPSYEECDWIEAERQLSST